MNSKVISDFFVATVGSLISQRAARSESAPALGRVCFFCADLDVVQLHVIVKLKVENEDKNKLREHLSSIKAE